MVLPMAQTMPGDRAQNMGLILVITKGGDSMARQILPGEAAPITSEIQNLRPSSNIFVSSHANSFCATVFDDNASVFT